MRGGGTWHYKNECKMRKPNKWIRHWWWSDELKGKILKIFIESDSGNEQWIFWWNITNKRSYIRRKLH